ncbi:MAG: tRNA (adenosine(37)-N6)-dimethylallyltransferase MiaA [Bacteroidota bacterium]
MKKLIVIGGATATGKTALAIKLAQHFGTEIISADSRQFYRSMSIGTAKPNAEELAAAKHHFIDSLDVTQSYSVGEFEQDCLRLLDTLFLTQEYVILVGGSGLFIRAVCEGLDTFPEVPESILQQVEIGEQNGGLPWLQQQVQQLDPEYFKQVDRNNPARLRRALEVCLAAGQPYSSFRSGQKQTRPFRPIYLLLEVPRPTLYARIDARVDAMIAAGLEDEARDLLPFRHLSALRTVGYEEFFDYFDGHLTFPEAVDKIKQHSRNYAKRQATWFRKHGDWNVIDPLDAVSKIVGIIG